MPLKMGIVGGKLRRVQGFHQWVGPPREKDEQGSWIVTGVGGYVKHVPALVITGLDVDFNLID